MQDGQQPNQPGWVFKPGEDAPETPELPSVAPQTAPGPVSQPEPAPAPDPVPQPAEPAPSQPEPEQDPQQVPNPPAPDQSALSHGEDHIEWTASEYISSPKNAGWFTLLALGSIVLAIAVYFITKEVATTVVIGILGILVGIFAARQPQTLKYSIDTSGITIGNKFYPYNGFKAFSIARDHAIGFIQLLPLRRFMPPLVIHYAPEDENHIAEVLADFLPYEEHKADVVDSLTRKLRF